MHAKKKMKGNHYIAHRLDACLDPGFRRQHVHRQAARLSAPQELNREQSGQRAVYQELFSTDWVSDSLENFLLGLECEWLLTAHRQSFLFYSLIEGHFITIGEKFVFTTKSSRWNWCRVRLYINKTSCFPGKTVLLKLNSTCFFHFLCSGDIHLTPLWFMILQTRLASHSLVVLETFLTILPLQRLWGLLASGGSGRGSHPWWAPLPYRSRSSWNSRGQTLHRLLQGRNFCQRLHLSTGTHCRCSKMRSRI